MLRSGIEMEVEEFANELAQPPVLTACAEAYFARLDDYRMNLRDGQSLNVDQVMNTCNALLSTLRVINDQRTVDAVRRMRDLESEFRNRTDAR